ncbi:hypothetical protein ABZX44_32495, partial [Streptomyces antibioticus]
EWRADRRATGSPPATVTAGALPLTRSAPATPPLRGGNRRLGRAPPSRLPRRYREAGATEVVFTATGLAGEEDRLRTWKLLGELANG